MSDDLSDDERTFTRDIKALFDVLGAVGLAVVAVVSVAVLAGWVPGY